MVEVQCGYSGWERRKSPGKPLKAYDVYVHVLTRRPGLTEREYAGLCLVSQRTIGRYRRRYINGQAAEKSR